ncbi:MAG: DUF3465 domain-containing protein [Methylococcaceae bacterium]|nr:DUF3465 domain-containing protein [Methylococcaceae bacterium]
MKKILLIIILASISIYETAQQQKNTSPNNDSSQIKNTHNSSNSLQKAFKNRRSDFQIQDGGTVIKNLPDDLKGSRHQKFILKNNTGETVLVAHNIDLAPKIKSLKEGDRVDFYGEYEWNPRGGVVHWTHNDPKGRHISGWLKHKGKTYQ